MSVWELYTQLFARKWRCGRFARSLSQGCSEKIKKERRWYDSKEMVGLINSDPAGSWCSGELRWKLDLLLWPRDQETEFPVEACWLSQTQEGQTEQIHPQTFDDPFFFFFFLLHWHDLHALGSHWTDSQRGILCLAFKGVQEKIPWEEASTLQIGSVAISSRTMYQSTTPSLSQTIWPR